MKKTDNIKKMDDILTNIIIFILIGVLGYTVYSKIQGKDVYFFGYRPAFAMTGSMQPEIMTHSIIISKKVTEPEKEIAVGDIVSFDTLQNGETVNITHRIQRIEENYIITKGDNNKDADLYPVPIESVSSKVVFIWNGFAKIYNSVAFFINYIVSFKSVSITLLFMGGYSFFIFKLLKIEGIGFGEGK